MPISHLHDVLRQVHVTAVMASGTLFFLRGTAVTLMNAHWPHRPAVRYLSYTIDSILLAAALMLIAVIHQYPFVQAWLTVKVLLLVVYIGLGTIAIKRGKSLAIRRAAFVAALGVFVFIASVAHTHNPLGLFTTL